MCDHVHAEEDELLVLGIAHIDGNTLVEDQRQDTANCQNGQIQHNLDCGGGDQQQ